VGRTIAVEELLEVLERDRLLYERSGGGVTFSGGEPLFQPEFLLSALRECKNRGIHAALDTSGYAPPEVFQKIAPWANLFLFDLKLLDPEDHRRFTEVTNTWILENLASLIETGRGKDVIIRIPIIPGITDTERNLAGLGEFLRGLYAKGGVRGVELLPYHDVAEKYARLGRPYPLPPLSRPSEEKLSLLREKLACAL